MSKKTIYLDDAIDAIEMEKLKHGDYLTSSHVGYEISEDVIKELPSAQPQYEELTPEEAASEIASGSIMSASYWLDLMIRLKQMGYAICRKKG